MKNEVVNISSKLDLVKEVWTPKIIEQINDYHIKIAKFKDDFVWHTHADTDEVFIVIEGSMTIHFRDKEVHLNKGDMYVVPKGIEHKPSALKTCEVMLIEPAGTINTGDVESDLKASNREWI